MESYLFRSIKRKKPKKAIPKDIPIITEKKKITPVISETKAKEIDDTKEKASPFSRNNNSA